MLRALYLKELHWLIWKYYIFFTIYNIYYVLMQYKGSQRLLQIIGAHSWPGQWTLKHLLKSRHQRGARPTDDWGLFHNRNAIDCFLQQCFFTGLKKSTGSADPQQTALALPWHACQKHMWLVSGVPAWRKGLPCFTGTGGWVASAKPHVDDIPGTVKFFLLERFTVELLMLHMVRHQGWALQFPAGYGTLLGSNQQGLDPWRTPTIICYSCAAWGRCRCR